MSIGVRIDVDVDDDLGVKFDVDMMLTSSDSKKLCTVGILPDDTLNNNGVSVILYVIDSRSFVQDSN